MSLTPGTKIGPYEIVALIGEGGMGEVYRARDTKLDREVAIKVLPHLLAQDPERLARFEREAKVLAALNHPNIAQIYGLEQRALVMELVPGETLKGPLPLETALNYAKQIAEALEAAHEKGITHRDLKPANIMITPAGVVKVLDFGLAAVTQPSAASEGDPTDSPTLTMRATQAGMIMGTAAYMSPEQAAGQTVDRRADIWAFGVVLWEMLTGQRLFTGDTVAHTLAAVLQSPIDFGKLTVPAPIRNLLRRCLDRDVKNRLQWIGEARIAIQNYPASPASAPDVTQSALSRSRSGWVARGVAGLAIVCALGVSFVHFRQKRPEVRVLHATILPPDNAAFDFTQGLGLLALSPDGKRIVFGARTADGKSPLWVRSLDVPTAQALAGTEGATFPFWSPDSRFIAFFADGKLKKIDASGGPAIALADAVQGRGGSWSREGVIVFSPANTNGPILRVSSSGGVASPVSSEIGSLPWFLPDGQHFLFQAPTRVAASGEYLIHCGSLDGSKSKLVGTGSSNALYAQGHLLFVRDGTLMAQPFDVQRLVTAGEAVPVAEQIETVLNSGRVGAFSVSATGLLVYRQGAGVGGEALTWFDRGGRQGAPLGDAAFFLGYFQFSPDRKSIAAGLGDRGRTSDVWIYDVSRGLRTRLTFDPAVDRDPVWSPDGRTIVFRSNRKGHYDLYRKSADGGGAEELFYADDHDKTPTSWSADGKFLLYYGAGADAKTRADIWGLPLTPERSGAALKPFPVAQTSFVEVNGQFSPSGKWIAYQSDESGRFEIYVTPFAPSSTGAGGKRQISTAGGVLPRWRQDGKEIFYAGPDNRLMAAEVSTNGGPVEVGQIHALFGLPNLGVNAVYDVSADGQRFLHPVAAEQKSAEPLTLIENWLMALEK
jgi:eukaryotic-like serine/threonine-protein kinase